MKRATRQLKIIFQRSSNGASKTYEKWIFGARLYQNSRIISRHSIKVLIYETAILNNKKTLEKSKASVYYIGIDTVTEKRFHIMK
jgi:hypothetical protein